MNNPSKPYIILKNGARIYERVADMPSETQAEMARDAKIDASAARRRQLAEDRPDFDFERDQGERQS